MAAANSDLFRKGGANTVTTLAAPGKALAATSITVGSTTNYPTDTGIVIGIRQVDSDGVLVPGTYSEYNATVTSGTTFSIDAVPVLGSDQVYPAGSTTQVFLPVSSSAHNDLIDGLLVSHDQDGTLKAGAVDNAGVLASNVVETAKIKDGAVTPGKWTNPYKFSVYRNTSWTTGNFALAICAFNVVEYDTNNNISGGAYTAPVAGFYLFTTYIQYKDVPTGTILITSLTKNSTTTEYKRLDEIIVSTYGNYTRGGATVINLAANDVIRVGARSGGQAGGTDDITTYFTGTLLSMT